MRLLKGLVLGLLIERGLGQTEPAPGGGDAVATVADPPVVDPPVETNGGGDAPDPVPSAPPVGK